MTSLTSSLYLMGIAYPLLFIVMGVFAVLTYGLARVFPSKKEK